MFIMCTSTNTRIRFKFAKNMDVAPKSHGNAIAAVFRRLVTKWEGLNPDHFTVAVHDFEDDTGGAFEVQYVKQSEDGSHVLDLISLGDWDFATRSRVMRQVVDLARRFPSQHNDYNEGIVEAAETVTVGADGIISFSELKPIHSFLEKIPLKVLRITLPGHAPAPLIENLILLSEIFLTVMSRHKTYVIKVIIDSEVVEEHHVHDESQLTTADRTALNFYE